MLLEVLLEVLLGVLLEVLLGVLLEGSLWCLGERKNEEGRRASIAREMSHVLRGVARGVALVLT